jgi:asparagine synthase (glutamine-hydrolysing)
MCGILGILKLNGDLDAADYGLPNRSDILAHRGPDDHGYYLDDQIFMGHRRLSIIDLNTGKQPIFNEDETVCIVFNGEIYNFFEIRTELTNAGHIFRTNTDTEAIIHAYEQWGTDCLKRLRGMFTFALWDRTKKSLFIARDRLGIKPLFYCIHGDTFYFASEIKGILQYNDIPRSLDYSALASYFNFAYIPNPITIFRHIKKLPPGFYLEIKNATVRTKQYWDVQFIPDRSRTEKYFIDEFRQLLEESVRLRLVSDVPIGAFLSGGVDSGAIVAMMAKTADEAVRTLSIGFGGDVGGYFDERSIAREVSERYHTRHTETEVVPDVSSIFDKVVGAFDEPFADPTTIPSYYLYQQARRQVTVALSGLGGDEMFGGYERYLGYRLSLIYNRLPFRIRENLIRHIVERIPERTDGHYTINHLKRFVRSASLQDDKRYVGFISMLANKGYQNLFEGDLKINRYTDNAEALFLDHFNASAATDPVDKVFYTDIKTYLCEDILACTDRLSMHHSLEVRVPFVDHKVVEFCATIPWEMKIKWGQKKYLLRKAVGLYLPKSVIAHRKQGFIGPMTRWLQTDLKQQMLDILSDENLSKHNLFNPEVVRAIVSDHLKHVEINDKLIWSLMVFQKWYNLYVD